MNRLLIDTPSVLNALDKHIIDISVVDINIDDMRSIFKKTAITENNLSIKSSEIVASINKFFNNDNPQLLFDDYLDVLVVKNTKISDCYQIPPNNFLIFWITYLQKMYEKFPEKQDNLNTYMFNELFDVNFFDRFIKIEVGLSYNRASTHYCANLAMNFYIASKICPLFSEGLLLDIENNIKRCFIYILTEKLSDKYSIKDISYSVQASQQLLNTFLYNCGEDKEQYIKRFLIFLNDLEINHKNELIIFLEKKLVDIKNEKPIKQFSTEKKQNFKI